MTSQRPDKQLPLIELFGPTIQGEGVMCGNQTHFLRLGVCDYKCTFCDSKHAVDPEQIKQWAKYKTTNEILADIAVLDAEYKTPWMTITGGNPCVHNLKNLVAGIQSIGMKVAIETQGTHMPTWLMDVDLLTISPKGPGMGETFNPSMYESFVDTYIMPTIEQPDWTGPEVCIKVVVFGEEDFEFAKMIWAYHPEIPMYLSLGNKWLPEEEISGEKHVMLLTEHYRNLAEKLYKDPILNKAKFLPQLHTLIWSNDKGR